MRANTKTLYAIGLLCIGLLCSPSGQASYDNYEKMSSHLKEDFPEAEGWKIKTASEKKMFEWSLAMSLGSSLKSFLKGKTTQKFHPLLIKHGKNGGVEKIVGYLHVASKMEVVGKDGGWIVEEREYWEVLGINDPDKGWVRDLTPQQNAALAQDAFTRCLKGVEKMPLPMTCGDESTPLDSDGDLQPGPVLADAEVYKILNADATVCNEVYDVDSDLWFLECPDGSSKVIKKK